MHFPRDLVWSRPAGPEVPGPGESSLRLLEAWRAQLLDVGGAELMTRRGVLGGTEGGRYVWIAGFVFAFIEAVLFLQLNTYAWKFLEI